MSATLFDIPTWLKCLKATTKLNPKTAARYKTDESRNWLFMPQSHELPHTSECDHGLWPIMARFHFPPNIDSFHAQWHGSRPSKSDGSSPQPRCEQHNWSKSAQRRWQVGVDTRHALLLGPVAAHYRFMIQPSLCQNRIAQTYASDLVHLDVMGLGHKRRKQLHGQHESGWQSSSSQGNLGGTAGCMALSHSLT